MRLKNKVAIITGSASGFGRGIAKKFTDEGANLIMVDLNSKLLKKVSKNLSQDYFIADVSKASNFKSLFNYVYKKYNKIDIIVNNAGVTKDNLLMRMGEDDFNHVIKTNLNSVFNMTKAVQRTLLKQRSGSIIHMSSVVGVKGNAGQSNYSASKAGIIGFSKSIAEGN